MRVVRRLRSRPESPTAFRLTTAHRGAAPTRGRAPPFPSRSLPAAFGTRHIDAVLTALRSCSWRNWHRSHVTYTPSLYSSRSRQSTRGRPRSAPPRNPRFVKPTIMWNTARPAKPYPEANPNELEPSIRLKTPSFPEARLDATARLRRKPHHPGYVREAGYVGLTSAVVSEDGG